MTNVQAVKAFGTEFRYSKARDFEVIIDANGYINYSKLLESISGKSSKFKKLCERNSSILTLVYDYEKGKIDAYLRKSKKSSVVPFAATEENDENTSLPKILTISQLVEASVLIVYNGGSHRELWGAYGPRYLLDVLIMTTDIRYYRRIHDTLEAIDAYAVANNKSFAGELERIQEQYEEKLKRSKILIKEKDEALKRCKQRYHKESKAHKETQSAYDLLVNQHAEMMEELRLTHRDVNNGNDKLDLISTQLIESHDDIHELQLASQRLANLVINQNASNHSTGSIAFKLYIYTSNMIPKNAHHREEIAADELWLGCACGEKRYVKPRMPVDAHIVYKRRINSRDVYAHIVERSDEYILETNYRHMKIRADDIDEFFNHIDTLLQEQGEHSSVRDLDEIHQRVQQRHHQEQIQAHVHAIANAQNQELEELNNRKQELLAQYNDIHFVLNGWKRKVYTINNEFEIRYGVGGLMRRYLTRDEIMNGRFTNQRDARIKYE